MRLAIVGSRDFSDKYAIWSYLQRWIETTPLPLTVVSGGATGADAHAKKWALCHTVGYIEFTPAHKPRNDWSFAYAGPKPYSPANFLRRNTQIVEYADEVVAFMAKPSRGTLHTLRECHRIGRKHQVIGLVGGCPICHKQRSPDV